MKLAKNLERLGTESAFKILADLGGKDLVGNSKELADEVIWLNND